MRQVMRNGSFWMVLLGVAVGSALTQSFLAQPWARGQSTASENDLKSLTTQPAGSVTYGKMDGPSGAPRLIPFQAYLTDSNGRPVEGQHSLTFKLYDQAESGNYLGWSETHTDVPVSKGTVNVLLGKVVAFGTLTFDSPRYLSVAVDTGPEIVPRQQIIPAIYTVDADHAKEADHAVNADYAVNAEHAVNADNAANAQNAANADHATNADNAQNAVHAGDALQLVTPGTLDPAVTVDTSGNVGIGTTTPLAKLDVTGGDIRLDWNYTLGPYPLDTFSYDGRNMQDYALGWFNDSWDCCATAWLSGYAGIKMFTNAAVRVAITREGRIGIGTETPEVRLHVEGGTDVTPAGGAVLQLGPSSGENLGIDSNEIMARNNGTPSTLFLNADGGRILIGANDIGIKTLDPQFTLHVNGTAGKPGGGEWSVVSDARLKKNVRHLAGSLDRLLRLRGVSFEFIDPASIGESPGQRIGMIAQEVEQVMPDWVNEGLDGRKRLTVRGFAALAVEALRDLRDEKDHEIESLRRQNEAQNARIAALNARLERLEKMVLKQESGHATE